MWVTASHDEPNRGQLRVTTPPMRTPFVVGNWKLNKTIPESLALVTELKNQLGAVKGVAVGVAPVFTSLHAVAKRLEGSPIATCAPELPLGGLRRMDRRGVRAAARRCRRDLGDRRTQRAPPVLRGYQRQRRQEGAGRARRRPRRDRLRRRAARGARRRPDPGGRRRAARGWPRRHRGERRAASS